MSSGKRDPLDLLPTRPSARGDLGDRRRPVRSLMLGALSIWTSAWLSVTAAAAPPGLDALPDPGDLPEVDAEPEPTAAGEAKAGDDAAGEDESAVDLSDEAEAPPSKPSKPVKASAPKSAVKKLSKPKWIKHEIVPGERLDDIATRYDVRTASLIRWNKLDPDKPRIYAGRTLAVYTQHIPPPQQKIIYTVEYGDTWAKIAAEYGVDPEHLRERWNPKVPRSFKAGQEIVIWVDPMTNPASLGDTGEELTKASAGTSAGISAAGKRATSAATQALPLIAIPKGAVSVGTPNKGKLVNSITLPENPQLYTIRRPEEAFGSSHALHNLQLAIAQWRQATGFTGKLLIGAISKKGGGRLRPHSSHQSGRDVDIRLPLKHPDGSSDNVEDVDWDATWALILAFVATGEVEYIFLTTDRQRHLLKAAKRAGASKDLIDRILQYPETSGNKNGIVRNQKGHTAHIHVRFKCAANETRCETY